MIRRRPSPGIRHPAQLFVRAAIGLLLMAGGTLAAAGDPPAPLQIETLQSQIPVGAAFDLGVAPGANTSLPPGATVTDVRFGEINDAWHVAEDWRQPLSGNSTKPEWLWSARLQFFEIGETALPAVEAVLRRADGTTEVLTLEGPLITVIDGLDDTKAELLDFYDIHPFRRDWRIIAAWAAGGAFAALLAGLLLYRAYRSRKPVPGSAPPLSPQEWALREIERRRALPECREGNSKIIATEASDVVRRYLEKRFLFPAMEMTSRECVSRLESTFVPAGLPDIVREFLDECDLAKFTRIEMEPGRRETLWGEARRIVEYSTPEPGPPPASPERPVAPGQTVAP